MISEGELRRVAGKARMGAGACELQYVILCAFDALTETEPLAGNFCLKGGTALRQLYFPDWRHSVDLDFSVLPALPPQQLREGLEAWFRKAGARHGLEMSLRDFHRANGAARARASYHGPLGHPGRLLLDVTLDEPVLLPPQKRPVIGTLFTSPRPLVLAYALEEILAEKLRSILQRGKARDYYDVWRLLGEKGETYDRAAARRLFFQKCNVKGLPDSSAAAFLDRTLLNGAAPYWSRDLAGQVTGAFPVWDDVVADLERLLPQFLAT
jgi:predicted nucleotidyltransferase component of viral defense system